MLLLVEDNHNQNPRSSSCAMQKGFLTTFIIRNGFQWHPGLCFMICGQICMSHMSGDTLACLTCFSYCILLCSCCLVENRIWTWWWMLKCNGRRNRKNLLCILWATWQPIDIGILSVLVCSMMFWYRNISGMRVELKETSLHLVSGLQTSWLISLLFTLYSDRILSPNDVL